jgi:lysophospholipase L1-like esterase
MRSLSPSSPATRSSGPRRGAPGARLARRTWPLAALVLVLGGSAASAQTDFRTYVALGDSLTAGFSSGSLVVTHQANSYPALLARQGAASVFQQPTVSEPGIPPQLVLVRLVPAPVIAPSADEPGAPTNAGLGPPYNNLGVPGATSIDLLTRTSDDGGFHDLVLRRRGATALQQGLSLQPSFVTLWIGNNDVLGAAIRGTAIDGVTLTPVDAFRAAYTGIVAALQAAEVPVVTANLPDVTTIPFVTTIPPYVVDPASGQPVLVDGQRVPLLGPAGPLGSGSFVTLAASSLLAQGLGIPAAVGGTGQPLPGEVILDANEVAVIRDHVAANNRAIAEIAGAAGFPVLDVATLLNEIATTGREVGGVRLTSAFLTGGVFSYDGVHLSDLGYAFLANEWIRVINENGGDLAPVNLAGYLGLATRAQGGPQPLTPPFEFSIEAYRRLLASFPTLDRP